MENDLNFLFMIGNKRSGTSLLVRLLNLHPEVFIAHESDAIWILYQTVNGLPMRPYPWDGPIGMRATLDACKDILGDETQKLTGPGEVQRLFVRMLKRIMNQGSRVQQPYAKDMLSWIGDKKPPQQADPDVFAFIMEHFPGARFLHLIRDPKAVVASMADAARNWGDDWGPVGFWKNSVEEILERWATHEEWVLAAKAANTSAVFSLRFEDLCENPQKKMNEIFTFMNLELTAEIADQIGKAVKSGVNAKHQNFILPESQRADAIMDIYHYRRNQ